MEDIVVTVWRLIKERSSVRRVSLELGVDRASLYRSLKKGTHPRIDTIMKFLNHLGYQLQVVKVRPKRKKRIRSKGTKSTHSTPRSKARGMLRVNTERRFLPRFKNRGLAPSNVSRRGNKKQ